MTLVDRRIVAEALLREAVRDISPHPRFTALFDAFTLACHEAGFLVDDVVKHFEERGQA